MDKYLGGMRKVALVLVGLFLLIQFYRPNKNEGAFYAEKDFLEIYQAPEEIRSLMKHSCYDCHSNHTEYAWYDNIAPVSWWVDETIRNGKSAINFSEWEQTDPQRRLTFLSASVFDIRTHKMPPKQYLDMHPTAQMSAEEQEKLINWIDNINRFNPDFEIKEH